MSIYDKAFSLEWNGQIHVLTYRNALTGGNAISGTGSLINPSIQYNYLYSYDGNTWSQGNINTSQLYTYRDPYSIKWTGTNFQMFGNISSTIINSNQLLIKSIDGINYSPVSQTNLTNIIYDLEVNLETPNTITFPQNTTLALGQGSLNIAYSINSGQSWTSTVNTPFSIQSNTAIWNGKLWTAVGSGGNTIGTSPDGQNWTGRGAIVFTNSATSISWSNELALWTATGQGKNTMAYSYDAIFWTGLGSSIFSQGNAIQWNGAIFVAVGIPAAGSKSIAYSIDGKNWSVPGQSNLFDMSGINIGWNGQSWIAVGQSSNSSNMAISMDGKIWSVFNNTNILGTVVNLYTSPRTNVTIINTTSGTYTFLNNNFNQVAQTLASSNTSFYNDAYYLIGGATYKSSPDAIHWSASSSVVGLTAINNFAWNYPDQGASKIKPLTIALGDGANNTIGYSVDGIYWNGLGKNVFSSRGNRAVWNGILWVGVGTGGNWTATSYDGLNWTGTNDGTMSEGIDIAWNGQVFVATGISATSPIATSRDGLIWTKNSSSASVFTSQASGIAWTGNVWIAYGSGGNTTAISRTSDASVWTATTPKNLAITDASSIFCLPALASPVYFTTAISKTSFIGNVYSSQQTGFESWKAFDNTFNGTVTQWKSAIGQYNSSGIYTGQGNTVTTSQTVLGEWIQLSYTIVNNLPIIYYYIVLPIDTVTISNNTNLPKEWYLFGSTTGTASSWNQLDYFNFNNQYPPNNSWKNSNLVIPRNLYANNQIYNYYRIAVTQTFGGNCCTLSEFDLYVSNTKSNILDRMMKPIVTNNAILYQTNLINFKTPNIKQTVYQIADLNNNLIGNAMILGNTYINTTLNGAQNYPISSTCFDGQNYVITPTLGGICTMNNRAINSTLNFDTSYNGAVISSSIGSGIAGNVNASCYNGQYVLFGGNKLTPTTGNVITYSNFGVGTSAVWYNTNASAIFGNVNGLASNSGYGWTVSPNRIYMAANDKLSIISPKAYNQNITNASISMNLTNTYQA